MGFPNCKIEVYYPNGNLNQTIINAIECHTKDIFTSSVGTFSFTLSAQTGLSYPLNTIGNNDKVKIYFGYNGNYVHVFTGRILPYTSVIGNPTTRIFEGKSLSEILERRFKYNKRWQNVEADDIAAEVASDLSLTGDLATDTTAETITVRTESYFDLLKKVSDYWFDGSTAVKKDFGVNKDNVLVWKTRPLRTVGVETFTYGNDFLDYTLKHDILPVKNKITVYGGSSAPYPLDRDEFTETITGWTEINGTASAETGGVLGVKEGTYRIHIEGNTYVGMYYTLPKRIFLRDISNLNFWYNHASVTPAVQLYAPDSSNLFSANLETSAGWHFFEGGLGEANEYDVDERPTGIWHKTGSPNWWDIEAVAFESSPDTGAFSFDVDKLWFYPERWVSTAEDVVGSQASYGLREAEFTDDNLLSESECEKRAKTLLYQLKDRVRRLDFTVEGNTNVLVGDRLSMTLPPDNLSAVAFDVVSVEHHFTIREFQTVVHALDTANSRDLPSASPLESIRHQLNRSREIQAEIYTRIVR